MAVKYTEAGITYRDGVPNGEIYWAPYGELPQIPALPFMPLTPPAVDNFQLAALAIVFGLNETESGIFFSRARQISKSHTPDVIQKLLMDLAIEIKGMGL